MEKKFFIIIIVIAIFIGTLTKGNAISTYNLVGYLDLDIDFTDQSKNGNDASAGNGATITDTGCKLGNCTHFDGTNQYINWGNISLGQNFTYCAWYYFDDEGGSSAIIQPFMGKLDSGNNARAPVDAAYYSGTEDDLQFGIGNGATQTVNKLPENEQLSTTDWKFYCFIVNSTTQRVYTNGVLNATASHSQALDDDETAELWIGSRPDGGLGYMDGLVDEITLWNISLSQNNITELYNADGSPDITDISITLLSSLENTENYNDVTLDIYYNFTLGVDNTLNTVNCTLFVNDILNTTQTERNASTNYQFTLDTSDREENFNLSIQCNNTEVTGNTGNFLYKIDNVIPIILGRTNENNYTVNDIVHFYSNCTDVNLFAVNETWKDPNGDVLENYYYENLTTTFTQNHTTYTVTSEGNYSIFKECWDSHTVINIPDYTWSKYSILNPTNNKTYKGIKFNDNNFNISTDDYSNIEGFGLIKKKDRYLMEYNFTTTGLTTTLYIGSSKNIKIISSDYQGHMIIGQKHWLDWVSDDVEDFSLDYLENYNVYRVRFTPLNSNVKFYSIGDLNYVNQTFTFEVFTEDSLNTTLLTSIDLHLSNIEGVITLIAIVILYGILLITGYYMVKKGDIYFGFTLLTMSSAIDLYIVSYIYQTYIQNLSDSTFTSVFTGLFGVLYIIGSFGKLIMPFRIKVKKKYK